jgi:hypothetical protein
MMSMEKTIYKSVLECKAQLIGFLRSILRKKWQSREMEAKIQIRLSIIMRSHQSLMEKAEEVVLPFSF